MTATATITRRPEETLMRHITCIEDLRELHRRKVPKAFFDYADRGSYSEQTLRANRADLERVKFLQRILVDVSKRDLSTTILGEPAALPLVLAPVGLLGMQHGDAGMDAVKTAGFCQQASVGLRRGARQAPHLWQSDGASERHRGHHRAVGVDQLAIRHLAELEGRRLDPQHLARQAGAEGNPGRRG